MAIFPRIQSPCPYLNRLSTLMDGDMCRMCERQVVDLSAMSDVERATLMKGCTGKVCVQYRMRPVIAAAALAAAASIPTAAAACDASSEMIVVVGGINDPAHVEYVQDPADASIPQLPVVYEPANADDTSSSVPPQQPSS